MMLEDKPTISSAKGKGKERNNWQLGWWDFLTLIEGSQRPLDWSESSVIFTAHPSEPYIVARHFLSSKQFVVPSPPLVLQSPIVFEPPSVISASPNDDWLFAYFPRRDDGGVGCLWERGAQIDNWNIKEYWNFALHADVVTAAWLGNNREWAYQFSNQSFARFPPRGPRTPVSRSTLLLITQDHKAQLCYFRQYSPSWRIITCSLLYPDISSDERLAAKHDKSLRGTQCIAAAIGVGYNETSIIVATRSCRLATSSTSSSFDDVILPVVDGSPSLEDQVTEWDTLGEDTIVNLCEIQLKFDSRQMSLISRPLAPILLQQLHVVNLSFVCTPPMEGSQEHIYLAITSLDTQNYSSTPKSELSIYDIQRLPMQTGIPNLPPWTALKVGHRVFPKGVLHHLGPSARFRPSQGQAVFACIQDTGGSLPQAGVCETVIGSMRALKLPDIGDSPDWEGGSIFSKSSKAGSDSFSNAIFSPNGTLLCTISSSLSSSKCSIHLTPQEKPLLQTPSHATISLALAVLSRRQTDDITHSLASPSMPLNDAVSVVYEAMALVAGQEELTESMMWNFVGETMAIHRLRCTRAKLENERAALEAKWKAAHDLCSLMACNRAFDDCREGRAYNLDAVWQLFGLSTWIVEFTEKVAKEAVLLWGLNTLVPHDDISTLPDMDSPLLLSLVQPLALNNFCSAVMHVKGFRSYLGHLSASSENAQTAKELLVDLVDHSGIEFAALTSLLNEAAQESKSLPRNDCWKAMASCQPIDAMQPQLKKTVAKLVQSKILDKRTLFFKTSDFAGNSSKFSVVSKKRREKDVITKRLLSEQESSYSCLRCGGKSEVGKDILARTNFCAAWWAWEKMWARRCVCGGVWRTSTI